MPEVGSWKDWLLWPLRSRFGACGESLRKPEQALCGPVVGREANEEDLFFLGLPPFMETDAEAVRFLGLENSPSEPHAVFRVESDSHPEGYYFSRLTFRQVQEAGAYYASFSRPEEHLKALRALALHHPDVAETWLDADVQP